MSEQIFQVSEFNEYISTYLSQISQVVIEGEISSITISQNKWIYITIKDKTASVEVFATSYQIYNYDQLQQGMLVHIYGTPKLYQKTGRFSVTANRIVPAGEGALRIAFERLKLKLEREGLFTRKRPLPAFPEHIGLITAKDSRAYSDFVKVLKERMGGIKISFFPVTVQGKDAISSITQAFTYFNTQQNIDLIVLTRGGGSLEDLQSFNDEQVARAIFSSKVPVVCGVGHEADISIADFVSDVRASTPSNAAELIVRSRSELLRDITFKTKTIESSLKKLLDQKKQLLRTSVTILQNAIQNEIQNVRSVVNRFTTEFSLFTRECTSFHQKIMSIERQLIKVQEYWMKQKKIELTSLTRLLESLDFNKVLARGFSITTDANGKILKSSQTLTQGQPITTTLFHGKIQSEIAKTYE